MGNLLAPDELWRAFAGTFGADTLIRKYGEKPPPEWEKAISALPNTDLARGMRRMLASGTPHIPTLPQFLKFCREVGDDGAAAPMLPRREEPPVDPILSSANSRLLVYVWKQMKSWHGLDPDWHNARTAVFVKWKNEWVRLVRSADPDERTAANTSQWWRGCMASAEEEAAAHPLCPRAPEPPPPPVITRAPGRQREQVPLPPKASEIPWWEA